MTVTPVPGAPAGAGPPGPPASRWCRLRVRAPRLGRYALTSVVATGVSEVTLLALVGAHLLAASPASVVASLAGAVPSYPMSRYWIWPEADRRRAGRQATAYWATALAGLGLATVATGLAAANSPTGHLAHLVVVGIAYVGTYGVLWVAKFAFYQRTVFRPAPPAGGRAVR